MLSNLSRSTGNETMKVHQLNECEMRNIFLQKSYAKCVGETSSRLFSKKSSLSTSLDKQSEIL